jgi:hypothetical protein
MRASAASAGHHGSSSWQRHNTNGAAESRSLRTQTASPARTARLPALCCRLRPALPACPPSAADCGPQCQERDWGTHKRYCAMLRKALQPW